MSDINRLFRQRIGWPMDTELTFESLPLLLERTALTFPFENLALLGGDAAAITPSHLIGKMLHRREGGLCYELNPLLYWFLQDNGLDVELMRGVVYNTESGDWGATGRTHVLILLHHAGDSWLVDSGFGGNLPLRPVPLRGEVVSSWNGEFRIRAEATRHGDHVFDLRLRYKDNAWRLGYAFDLSRKLEEMEELSQVRDRVRDHPASPFNKKPLITRLTRQGQLTLTDRTLTEWKDGHVSRVQIEAAQFPLLSRRLFSLDC